MKKSRKSVQFHLTPKFGHFQVIYLGLDGFVPPWRVGLEYDPPPVIGPFLYSVSDGAIIHFDVEKRFIDHYVQGMPVVGKETNFEHFCAYGDLYESQFTRIIEYAAEHQYLFQPPDFSVIADRILSYNADWEPVDYLQTYGFLSYAETEKIYDPVLLLNKKLTYRYFDSGDLRRVVYGDVDGLLDFAWLPDGSAGLSNRFTIHKFNKLQVESLKARLPVAIEALDSAKHRLWRYEFYTLCRIIPVSPVFSIDDSDGSIRNARVASACDFIAGQLTAASKLADENDEFNSCAEAVKGFQSCDINGLAFIKDFKEIKNLIEPLIGLFKKPLVLKNWAGIALWWKYGVKLTFQDCKELIHALTNLKSALRTWREYIEYKNSLHTRYGTSFRSIDTLSNFPVKGKCRCNTRITARPHVSLEETPIAAVGALLEELDFKISAEHLWDLLPYSFVLDWFVDIGGLLSKADYRQTIGKYDLRDRIYSHHVKVTPEQSAFLPFQFVGTVTLDAYVRQVSTSFPLPPMGLDTSTAFLNHLWEGALLAIVAKK